MAISVRFCVAQGLDSFRLVYAVQAQVVDKPGLGP